MTYSDNKQAKRRQTSAHTTTKQDIIMTRSISSSSSRVGVSTFNTFDHNIEQQLVHFGGFTCWRRGGEVCLRRRYVAAAASVVDVAADDGQTFVFCAS